MTYLCFEMDEDKQPSLADEAWKNLDMDEEPPPPIVKPESVVIIEADDDDVVTQPPRPRKRNIVTEEPPDALVEYQPVTSTVTSIVEVDDNLQPITVDDDIDEGDAEDETGSVVSDAADGAGDTVGVYFKNHPTDAQAIEQANIAAQLGQRRQLSVFIQSDDESSGDELVAPHAAPSPTGKEVIKDMTESIVKGLAVVNAADAASDAEDDDFVPNESESSSSSSSDEEDEIESKEARGNTLQGMRKLLKSHYPERHAVFSSGVRDEETDAAYFHGDYPQKSHLDPMVNMFNVNLTEGVRNNTQLKRDITTILSTIAPSDVDTKKIWKKQMLLHMDGSPPPVGQEAVWTIEHWTTEYAYMAYDGMFTQSFRRVGKGEIEFTGPLRKTVSAERSRYAVPCVDCMIYRSFNSKFTASDATEFMARLADDDGYFRCTGKKWRDAIKAHDGIEYAFSELMWDEEADVWVYDFADFECGERRRSSTYHPPYKPRQVACKICEKVYNVNPITWARHAKELQMEATCEGLTGILDTECNEANKGKRSAENAAPEIDISEHQTRCIVCGVWRLAFRPDVPEKIFECEYEYTEGCKQPLAIGLDDQYFMDHWEQPTAAPEGEPTWHPFVHCTECSIWRWVLPDIRASNQAPSTMTNAEFFTDLMKAKGWAITCAEMATLFPDKLSGLTCKTLRPGSRDYKVQNYETCSFCCRYYVADFKPDNTAIFDSTSARRVCSNGACCPEHCAESPWPCSLAEHEAVSKISDNDKEKKYSSRKVHNLRKYIVRDALERWKWIKANYDHYEFNIGNGANQHSFLLDVDKDETGNAIFFTLDLMEQLSHGPGTAEHFGDAFACSLPAWPAQAMKYPISEDDAKHTYRLYRITCNDPTGLTAAGRIDMYYVPIPDTADEPPRKNFPNPRRTLTHATVFPLYVQEFIDHVAQQMFIHSPLGAHDSEFDTTAKKRKAFTTTASRAQNPFKLSVIDAHPLYDNREFLCGPRERDKMLSEDWAERTGAGLGLPVHNVRVRLPIMQREGSLVRSDILEVALPIDPLPISGIYDWSLSMYIANVVRVAFPSYDWPEYFPQSELKSRNFIEAFFPGGKAETLSVTKNPIIYSANAYRSQICDPFAYHNIGRAAIIAAAGHDFFFQTEVADSFNATNAYESEGYYLGAAAKNITYVALPFKVRKRARVFLPTARVRISRCNACARLFYIHVIADPPSIFYCGGDACLLIGPIDERASAIIGCNPVVSIDATTDNFIPFRVIASSPEHSVFKPGKYDDDLTYGDSFFPWLEQHQEEILKIKKTTESFKAANSTITSTYNYYQILQHIRTEWHIRIIVHLSAMLIGEGTLWRDITTMVESLISTLSASRADALSMKKLEVDVLQRAILLEEQREHDPENAPQSIFSDIAPAFNPRFKNEYLSASQLSKRYQSLDEKDKPAFYSAILDEFKRVFLFLDFVLIVSKSFLLKLIEKKQVLRDKRFDDAWNECRFPFALPNDNADRLFNNVGKVFTEDTRLDVVAFFRGKLNEQAGIDTVIDWLLSRVREGTKATPTAPFFLEMFNLACKHIMQGTMVDFIQRDERVSMGPRAKTFAAITTQKGRVFPELPSPKGKYQESLEKGYQSDDEVLEPKKPSFNQKSDTEMLPEHFDRTRLEKVIKDKKRKDREEDEVEETNKRVDAFQQAVAGLEEKKDLSASVVTIEDATEEAVDVGSPATAVSGVLAHVQRISAVVRNTHFGDVREDAEKMLAVTKKWTKTATGPTLKALPSTQLFSDTPEQVLNRLFVAEDPKALPAPEPKTTKTKANIGIETLVRNEALVVFDAAKRTAKARVDIAYNEMATTGLLNTEEKKKAVEKSLKVYTDMRTEVALMGIGLDDAKAQKAECDHITGIILHAMKGGRPLEETALNVYHTLRPPGYWDYRIRGAGQAGEGLVLFPKEDNVLAHGRVIGNDGTVADGTAIIPDITESDPFPYLYRTPGFLTENIKKTTEALTNCRLTSAYIDLAIHLPISTFRSYCGFPIPTVLNHDHTPEKGAPNLVDFAKMKWAKSFMFNRKPLDPLPDGRSLPYTANCLDHHEKVIRHQLEFFIPKLNKDAERGAAKALALTRTTAFRNGFKKKKYDHYSLWSTLHAEWEVWRRAMPNVNPEHRLVWDYDLNDRLGYDDKPKAKSKARTEDDDASGDDNEREINENVKDAARASVREASVMARAGVKEIEDTKAYSKALLARCTHVCKNFHYFGDGGGVSEKKLCGDVCISLLDFLAKVQASLPSDPEDPKVDQRIAKMYATLAHRGTGKFRYSGPFIDLLVAKLAYAVIQKRGADYGNLFGTEYIVFVANEIVYWIKQAIKDADAILPIKLGAIDVSADLITCGRTRFVSYVASSFNTVWDAHIGEGATNMWKNEGLVYTSPIEWLSQLGVSPATRPGARPSRRGRDTERWEACSAVALLLLTEWMYPKFEDAPRKLRTERSFIHCFVKKATITPHIKQLKEVGGSSLWQATAPQVTQMLYDNFFYGMDHSGRTISEKVTPPFSLQILPKTKEAVERKYIILNDYPADYTSSDGATEAIEANFRFSFQVLSLSRKYLDRIQAEQRDIGVGAFSDDNDKKRVISSLMKQIASMRRISSIKDIFTNTGAFSAHRINCLVDYMWVHHQKISGIQLATQTNAFWTANNRNDLLKLAVKGPYQWAFNPSRELTNQYIYPPDFPQPVSRVPEAEVKEFGESLGPEQLYDVLKTMKEAELDTTKTKWPAVDKMLLDFFTSPMGCRGRLAHHLTAPNIYKSLFLKKGEKEADVAKVWDASELNCFLMRLIVTQIVLGQRPSDIPVVPGGKRERDDTTEAIVEAEPGMAAAIDQAPPSALPRHIPKKKVDKKPKPKDEPKPAKKPKSTPAPKVKPKTTETKKKAPPKAKPKKRETTNSRAISDCLDQDCGECRHCFTASMAKMHL